MQKKSLSIITVLTLSIGWALPSNIFAQHQWDNFPIGVHIMLNVSGPKPKLDTVHSPIYLGYPAVTDPRTGQLLFTGGSVGIQPGLLDRRMHLMPDGDYPGGGQWVCPVPGDDSAWFLLEHYYHTSFAKVDMRKDSGYGAVTLRNVQLAYNQTGGLVVVPNSDGYHYWLIQLGDTSTSGQGYIESYLIGPDGPTGPPVLSQVPAPSSRGISYWDYASGLASSPDGSTITDGAEVFHVNQKTGRVIYLRRILGGVLHWSEGYIGQPYIAFSHDGRFLYASGGPTNDAGYPVHYLVQFDLSRANDTGYIIATSDSGGFGEKAYAGDGRIYIPAWPYFWSINNPDSAGSACGFDSMVFRVGNGHDSLGAGGEFYNGIPSIVYSTVPQIESASLPSCASSCYSFWRPDSVPGFPKWTFDGGSPAHDSGSFIPQVCFNYPGAYEVQAVTSAGDTLMTLVAAGVPEGTVYPIQAANATVTPGSTYTLPVRLLLSYINGGPDATGDSIGHLMQEYVIQFDTSILSLPPNAAQAISLPPQDEIYSARQTGGTLKVVIEDTLGTSWWVIGHPSWRDTMDQLSVKFHVTNSSKWSSTRATLALFSLDDGLGTRYDFCPQENNLLATITNTQAGVASLPAVSDVRIYPNPTTGVVTISGAAAGADIAVENVLGESVVRNACRVMRDGSISLDLSSDPVGTYIVRVHAGKAGPRHAGDVVVKRIVKE